MTTDQWLILAILGGAIVLFLWGRFRHDLVALATLLLASAAGLINPDRAFSGFGHPAVITVACVLILSGGLQATGVIDALTRHIMPRNAGLSLSILVLTFLAAFLSAFMNNVGALALLMPVALQTARNLKIPPGRLLMPLAFASIFGGMVTLIGTPPNLIVSGIRAEKLGESYSMFDFTPVGLAVALAGVAFMAGLGWRMVPNRRSPAASGFETGSYVTEALVPEKSSAIGQTLGDLESKLEDHDATIIGIVRGNARIAAPSPYREVKSGDILIFEGEPKGIAAALSSLQLRLAEEVRGDNSTEAAEGVSTVSLRSDAVTVVEVAVRPNARLIGRTAKQIDLRQRYGINLLAVSREGDNRLSRLKTLSIKAGDVLLLQGAPADISDFSARFGCIPLADRNISLPSRKAAFTAVAIMCGAIAVGAFGLVPTAVGFATGALMMVLAGIVPVQRMYDAIDWSVIVLLGALMPVADAMSATGAADQLARLLVDNVAGSNAVVALAAVLVVTMTLSDFMNNAATAAVMSPIAIGIAANLGVSADAFLMAVAVGASCAFLTPIGHQNNTLILGPGGFHFSDYWKLGLPLEIIVCAVGIPALLYFWPL